MCPRCKRRKWPYEGEGSQPRCAFPDGVFNSDNWNCATANAIRDIAYEGQNPMPDGVDYRYCEDQKYATIYADDILEDSDPEVVGPEAVWVSWYKSRGTTDQIIALYSMGGAKPITLTQAEALIAFYVAHRGVEIEEEKPPLTKEQLKEWNAEFERLWAELEGGV